MNSKVQEAVDVVAAKWARLRHLRFRQVLAQQRLEQITEETMQASRVYDEAVEQLAAAARVTPDTPLPPPWPGSKPCVMCSHQIHYTAELGWVHSDDRPQCLSENGTTAAPYGYGLDDEPDGE